MTGGDDVDPRALQEVVEDLSRDAFALARDAAEGAHPAEDLQDRAGQLDRALEDLLDPLRTIPEDERAPLVEAWTDARMDVTWVLAGQQGPSSLRLGAYLREARPS